MPYLDIFVARRRADRMIASHGGGERTFIVMP